MPRENVLHPGDRLPGKRGKRYPNSRVRTVFENGSYSFYVFFIVESAYVGSIMKVFDSGMDNCNYALRSEMSDYIMQLCDKDQKDIWRSFIGFTKGTLFLYTKDPSASKYLLNISRKATSEEADELIKFVIEREEAWKKTFNKLIQEENERREAELEAEIEERRNNPDLIPGVRGEFRHYSAKQEDTHEKKYTLAEVRNFFKKLGECKALSPEVKDAMVFYGGTIPYLLCKNPGKTRKFGDVDIYLPEELMRRFREELADELTYIVDSLSLFKCTIYRGGRRALNETFAPRDCGFKAYLFGIQISVFPYEDKDTENGNVEICSKSCRLGKEGEWNYLLNTRIATGVIMANICSKVNIAGTEVKIIKVEYTEASKKNAINYGHALRQETDQKDLEFISKHREELNMCEDTLDFFMSIIPKYAVSKAYGIAYVPNDYNPEYGRVEMIDGEQYIDRVTQTQDDTACGSI